MRSQAFLSLVVSSLIAGCVAPAPPEPALPPPPPPPKILVEEEVRPVERPELAILEVEENRGSDPQMVEVVGRVLNRGPGRARQLSVTVHVLDDQGNELASLPAQVDSDTIEPNATVGFRLLLQRPGGASRYEVVAVARGQDERTR